VPDVQHVGQNSNPIGRWSYAAGAEILIVDQDYAVALPCSTIDYRIGMTIRMCVAAWKARCANSSQWAYNRSSLKHQPGASQIMLK
jgi:hypothetical protein